MHFSSSLFECSLRLIWQKQINSRQADNSTEKKNNNSLEKYSKYWKMDSSFLIYTIILIVSLSKNV